MNTEETRKACARSYSAFAMSMQEDGWFEPKHKELCDWIQYHVTKSIETEQDAKLLVIMPRGTLKTTMITKYFAAWSVLPSEDVSWKSTNNRTLIVTNTHTNARKKLEDIRGLFDQHKLFRGLFTEVLPKRTNRWTDECAEINRTVNFAEGTFEACGLQTKKTGSHYNFIIEDDTTAPHESDMSVDLTIPNRETIEKAIGWHQSATCLLVPKGPRVRLIVTTRWSDFDLVEHVMNNEDYKVFDISALNVEGEPNFPGLYNKAKLEEIKSQVGPYMFSCLYLNSPLDPSQRLFNDTDFQYVSPTQIPEGGYYTIALDPAISSKESACETAITLVKHVHESPIRHCQYWLAAIHGHFHLHEMIARTLQLADSLEDAPLKGILVEINAFQLALKVPFYEAMAHAEVSYPFIGVVTRSNKEERIAAMQPHFNAKQIFFLKGLSPQVESQLKQFPNGKLVDIIDSFSTHLRLYKRERVPEKLKQVKTISFDSWDNVLDEMEKRNVKGRALAARNDYGQSLDTGLGKKRQLSLVFGVN